MGFAYFVLLATIVAALTVAYMIAASWLLGKAADAMEAAVRWFNERFC